MSITHIKIDPQGRLTVDGKEVARLELATVLNLVIEPADVHISVNPHGELFVDDMHSGKSYRRAAYKKNVTMIAKSLEGFE